MKGVKRLLGIVLFASLCAGVGRMLGAESMYVRGAVFLFAGLCWGPVPGIIAAGAFAVPFVLAWTGGVPDLAAMCGTMLAAPCAPAVMKYPHGTRWLNAGIVVFYAGLLAFLYIFHLRGLPKVVVLPLVMALFCFMYYFMKVTRLRRVMRAELAALAVNYLIVFATAPLGRVWALDSGFVRNTHDAAWTVFRVLPADLLVILILAFLLPAAASMPGQQDEESRSCGY